MQYGTRYELYLLLNIKARENPYYSFIPAPRIESAKPCIKFVSKRHYQDALNIFCNAHVQ